jgi:hypothetical protein
VLRDGKRVSDWAAARLLDLDADQFSALALTNSVEYTRWQRLAEHLYFAAGLGLPAKAARHIATRVAQDDAFIRAAEPSLGRLYEELHPDIRNYLERVPNPETSLDGVWASRTDTGLLVVSLDCLTARRIDFGTPADRLVQSLLGYLSANGLQIVDVTEHELLIETGPDVGVAVVARVQQLIDQAIPETLGQIPVRCRVSVVAPEGTVSSGIA